MKISGIRVTPATLHTAVLLLSEPDSRHYGYETSKKIGVMTGTLYPIFDRFLTRNWITAAWEENPPAGRPARRFYELTPLGRTELSSFLTAAGGDRRYAEHARVAAPPISNPVTP